MKELLPEFDGVDRIHVDTIHSVLKYKRDRDNKVDFVPPSGFRKYEAVFCDEASQYEDLEWARLFQTVKEQPHLPYVVVVADFPAASTYEQRQSVQEVLRAYGNHRAGDLVSQQM